jgi:predicted dehydrogenase
MGFWKRLIKGEEDKPRVGVGFIGSGDDAGMLRKAYEDHVQAEIVAEKDIEEAEEVIRARGVQAVEIFAGPGEAADLAMACLKAGIHTSVPAPLALSIEKTDELIAAASRYDVILRVRQPALYYEPFIKAREIIDKQDIGWINNLKLMLKVTEMKDPSFDRGQWLIENETSFLALAEYLVGPVEKVYAWLDAKGTNGVPCTNMVMWKYKEKHQYGYMQIDFTPGLHVRTFTQPVFRSVEVTGNNAKIFINRAEGQLLRQPVLFVRSKDKTTSYELIKDDWREIYPAMARDMIRSVLTGKSPRSSATSSRRALKLALAAKESSEKGEEIYLKPGESQE